MACFTVGTFNFFGLGLVLALSLGLGCQSFKGFNAGFKDF